MVEIVLGMERIMIIVEKRGINGSQLYSAQVYANFWARLHVYIYIYICIQGESKVALDFCFFGCQILSGKSCC